MGGSFLDQQARIGISVHLRGLPATRRLLALCHLSEAREVRAYRLNPAREIRDRFRWVGFRRLLAGSMHAVGLYLTEPSARPVLDTMLVSLRTGPEDEPGRRHPGRSSGTGSSSVASRRT